MNTLQTITLLLRVYCLYISCELLVNCANISYNGVKDRKAPRVMPHPKGQDQGKESSLLSTASVHDERKVPTCSIAESELVRCFRHEAEGCPRCDGSGYRPRNRCAGCGEPAGQPSRGGKALVGLRNHRGQDQPFYCLGCHPELSRGSVMLQGVGS
jgi:hypothetical protein